MCPHTNHLNPCRLKRTETALCPRIDSRGIDAGIDALEEEHFTRMLTCFTSCWHALRAADMTSSEKGLNQLDVLASILEKQFKPIVRQANLLSEGKNPDMWQTPSDSPTASRGSLELSFGGVCMYAEEANPYWEQIVVKNPTALLVFGPNGWRFEGTRKTKKMFYFSVSRQPLGCNTRVQSASPRRSVTPQP